MVALIARPKRIALQKASLFTVGKTPGKPQSTRFTLVFGSAPKLVDALEKSFVLVES